MENTLTPHTGTGLQTQTGSRVVELIIWSGLLAAINFSLLMNTPPELFIFDLQAVKSGQLWRIVTYPFAHVSGYHLLMDASAFLMLYAGLEEKKMSKRLWYTAGCGIGSLLLPLAGSHIIGSVGLSGLSGIAHGLLAVTSMELLKNHQKGSAHFRTGAVLLSIVALKSVAEVWTGDVVFSGLHMGSIGAPIVEAHLGGVIGGIGSFIILNRRKRQPRLFQSGRGHGSG